VTTEHFTNDFVQAIRDRKTEEFRAKYRTADVLLLDDIQFLAGKEQTQESFFHTFNALHNANRQIVVACDRPPKAIALLEDRLRSRFEWGLLTDIQPPDLETRLAILQDKARTLGATLPMDVAQIIAKRMNGNIRELEGGMHRVVALAQFLDKAISTDLAAMALADLAPESPPKAITPDEAISVIAAHYHISPQVLCQRRRDRKTTLPQRVAMFILTEPLKHPPQDVASLLGSWHIRTVRNALKEITEHRLTIPALREDLSCILQTLGITES